VRSVPWSGGRAGIAGEYDPVCRSLAGKGAGDGPLRDVQCRGPVRKAASVQPGDMGAGRPIVDAVGEFNSLIARAGLRPCGQDAADPTPGPARRVPRDQRGRATEPDPVGCIYSVPAADLDVLVPIQSSERASLGRERRPPSPLSRLHDCLPTFNWRSSLWRTHPRAAPVGRSRPLGALPTPPANALVSPRTLINASQGARLPCVHGMPIAWVVQVGR